MFDDFAISQHQQQTRKRLRRSFAIAVLVYGSAGAALVSASNTARKLIKEDLMQVKFATPPEIKPEPKPEPPPPVEAPKPKSARAGVSQRKTALKPPDEMPSEKPTESSAALVAATESGPQDGVLGVVGGTGSDSVNAAPPPPPPKLVPAKELPGNRQPAYPKRAQRDGVEGEVVVAFDVLEDGRVVNPKIVKGPAEFHEAVLQIALTWRYRPATLGDKPVKHRMTKLVVFHLED